MSRKLSEESLSFRTMNRIAETFLSLHKYNNRESLQFSHH